MSTGQPHRTHTTWRCLIHTIINVYITFKSVHFAFFFSLLLFLHPRARILLQTIYTLKIFYVRCKLELLNFFFFYCFSLVNLRIDFIQTRKINNVFFFFFYELLSVDREKKIDAQIKKMMYFRHLVPCRFSWLTNLYLTLLCEQYS